jgi:5-(carboxyamino)imidazole ribonucleotide synthase
MTNYNWQSGVSEAKFPKIGILGGGQLGQMLIQPAISWHLPLFVLDPSEDAPCKRWCENFRQGSLLDYNTILNFGKDLDLITIEIEHVNVEALYTLEQMGKSVYPQARVLEIIQDKRVQKQFYLDQGVPTADFRLTEARADILNHLDFLPAFHKLGKGGYDGKGVQRINSAEQVPLGFDEPSLLEKAVDFHKEITVMVARSSKGEIKCFQPTEIVYHEQNLVDYLLSPADIPQSVINSAEKLAITVIEALDLIGTLAVEMFLLHNGSLLVNEVAPRPHNSGHQSIEANFTSQFEQHWRAILGLPLGDTGQRGYAAMLNIIAPEGAKGSAAYENFDKVLAIPRVYPHLYGKSQLKPFRKMGHLTIVGESRKEVIEKLAEIKLLLKVKPDLIF